MLTHTFSGRNLSLKKTHASARLVLFQPNSSNKSRQQATRNTEQSVTTTRLSEYGQKEGSSLYLYIQQLFLHKEVRLFTLFFFFEQSSSLSVTVAISSRRTREAATTSNLFSVWYWWYWTKPIRVESNHFSIKWAIRLSTDAELPPFLTFPSSKTGRRVFIITNPHLFAKLSPISWGTEQNRREGGSVKTIDAKFARSPNTI